MQVLFALVERWSSHDLIMMDGETVLRSSRWHAPVPEEMHANSTRGYRVPEGTLGR